MSEPTRRSILRANALYLLLASTGGFIADVSGIFLSRGPQARVMEAAPFTGIGFVEAHGLAFILGVLLWRALSTRAWHLTAAAVHVLLGMSNLVFWGIFPFANMMAAGYVTTSLHWLFVVLELSAAVATRGTPDTAAMAA